MNILVFGAQGSGKSTHAKYIAEKLGLPYIYTGDLFRRLEEEASPRGEQIRQLMDKGVLIPNDISIPAFAQYLKEFDISNGVVLDGYPRNIGQAERLPLKIDLVIYVTLDEKEAIKRLTERGRSDDTPEAIKERLRLYKQNTKPLLAYFENRGVDIVKIDNTPPVEEVQKEIDGLLKKRR